MRHHPKPTHRGTGRRRERGAGLVEYAMLMALIAIVTFSAVSFFGQSNGAGFGKSKTCISAAYDGTLGSSCPPSWSRQRPRR